MRANTNSKKTAILISSLLLFLVLAAILRVIRQSRELRERAAGLGIVRVGLTAGKTTLARGETTDVTLFLESTQDNVSVMVGGADLQFAPPAGTTQIQDVLEITNPACSSLFPSVARLGFDTANPNILYMSCHVGGGAAARPLPRGERVALGTFRIKYKDAATIQGAARISFNRTNVPGGEAMPTPFQDISDAGTPLDLILGSVVTPSPTSGPVTPTQPAATTTPTRAPTATPTLQPTSTPIPGCTCNPGDGLERRRVGDYDCNGVVNDADHGLWRNAYVLGGDITKDFDCQNGPGINDFTTWVNHKGQ